MLRLSLCVIVAATAFGLAGCGNNLPTADAMEPMDPPGRIPEFQFKIEFDGRDAGAFDGVSIGGSETEVIEFQDGQDPILRKRPGRTKYHNITLKKGFIVDADLWGWRKSIIEGNVERRNGAVILMNNNGDEVVRYNFFEAWPSKWKGFSLDGKGTDVAVEELEFVVERIERVDPSSSGR